MGSTMSIYDNNSCLGVLEQATGLQSLKGGQQMNILNSAIATPEVNTPTPVVSNVMDFGR